MNNFIRYSTLNNLRYGTTKEKHIRLVEKQMKEKRSLYYIDDSFRKIVVAKTGLNPMYDDEGVMTIDLFDFLLGDKALDSDVI